MILKNIKDEEINLSQSKLFNDHINKGGSYADFLVQQLNTHDLRRFFNNKNDINVIDLGGNIGLWTLYLAPICKNIITVEPTPAHCETAIDLFNFFDKKKNINLFNGAISDIDGFKEFCIGSKNSTMNSFYKHHDHNQTIKVQTFKLKTFIQKLNLKIDFIKMDIEGSEQQVILDAEFDSFIYDNVDNIYLEIHESLGADYKRIYNKIKQLNYNIEKIRNDTLYAFK